MGWIFLLFIIAVAWMFIGLISDGGGGMRAGRRIRTAREDALYTQIQDAMNWTPDMPRRCECGEWVNDKGEHLKSISLSDLMERCKQKNRCTKRSDDATRAGGPINGS